LLKSDVPTDELKRPKKEPCAPTPTLISVLALTHGCGLAMLAVDTVKSAEASRFRNTLVEAMPSSADSPMSSCGMRWAVASNVAPISGVVEIVTSVVRFQVELIRAGRSMAKVKAKTHAWRLV
jgi:hypothetical protein